jgi:hypothetical protein
MHDGSGGVPHLLAFDAGSPIHAFAVQLWILLAVATLSALPWMVIEFKKAHYSVHYQGK